MNPRAWAAWSAAALVVVLASTNPIYRLLVLLIAVNVLLALRREDATLRPLLVGVAVAAGVAAILNAALSHTGAHLLLSLPEAIPGVGGPITVEAFLYGVDVGLGIAAAVLCVAPLSRVLHAHDLLDAFPDFLQRTAALTGAAVNIVPSVARSAVAISEAQRMRGSAGTRLRDWRAIAAPVVLTALEGSLELAEAMEARGFGSGPRSRYARARFDAAAAAVTICALAAIGLIAGARIADVMPDWYPYPSVTAPATALVPTLACMLLTAPLLAWRRS